MVHYKVPKMMSMPSEKAVLQRKCGGLVKKRDGKSRVRQKECFLLWNKGIAVLLGADPGA
jgi:hypothetical protein